MAAQTLSEAPVTSARIRRILVIVNRKAGGVQRTPGLVEELKRSVGDRGDVQLTASSAEVVQAISRARLAGVDTVAMCGGDGTDLCTATALATVYGEAAWPRLAVLSGGTLNTVAHNLGCAGDAPRLLARLLAAEEPAVLVRPLLRVNEHTGFIFGSQMVARVLDAYYAGGASPAGAALLAAHMVVSAALRTRFVRELFKPELTALTLDGQALGLFRFTSLVASVVAAPAVGLRALYRAGEDGGFHVVGTEQSPSKIVAEAGRLWAGLPVSTMTVDAVAKQATLSFSKPARFSVDGDLFSASRIDLSVTQPVELLRPAMD